MNGKRAYKYGILCSGYLLVFGSYFLVRTCQFESRETAIGDITGVVWEKVPAISPTPAYGGEDDYRAEYQCPVVHFFYKSSPGDTGTWYTIRTQSLSNRDYRAGDKTNVIFPKGHPEQAKMYSLREFWFTTPYMIILTVVAALWSIAFLVAVFKPWQQM